MTDQRNILINFVPIETDRWSVSGIGGTNLAVMGQGDVIIVSNVNGKYLKGTMRGVLLVPGLGTNLYSIGTATAAGMDVLFTNDAVSFSRHGVTLMEGKRTGKTLYHLNIQAETQPIEVHTALKTTTVEPLSVWHQRFGHVNHRTLLKMASLGSTNGLILFNDKTHSDFCKDCLIGKMCRFPFKVGRQRASNVGDLIHTDVCGPFQVTTPGGNRYFVTFKDDYSGWCITRLLKCKSEVTPVLKELIAQIKTETGREVKVIRSDNGGEYLSTELESWMAKLGIRHEKSTPYTPQQNGVAERTNRNILETTRSILHG